MNISIGSNCACTAQIRRAFGTDRSFPFDWILTPIRSAIALFESGLDHQMTEDNLAVSRWGGSIVNKRFGVRYLHDFRIEDGWESQIPEVAAKYACRTRRLIETLDAAPVTLWYNAAPEKQFSASETDDMQNRELRLELESVIRQRFPMARVRFVEPAAGEDRIPGKEWAGSISAWDHAFQHALQSG